MTRAIHGAGWTGGADAGALARRLQRRDAHHRRLHPDLGLPAGQLLRRREPASPRSSFGACSDGTGTWPTTSAPTGSASADPAASRSACRATPAAGRSRAIRRRAPASSRPTAGPAARRTAPTGSTRPPSTCDGTGLCRIVTPKQCASYHCTGTQCTPACAQSSDCDGGYCAKKICLPDRRRAGARARRPRPAPPTRPAPPSSACDRCWAMLPRPARTAPPRAPPPTCDTTGACVYPGAETTCGTQTCRDSATQTPAPFCDAGGCQAAARRLVPPLRVQPDVPGACYTACNSAGGRLRPLRLLPRRRLRHQAGRGRPLQLDLDQHPGSGVQVEPVLRRLLLPAELPRDPLHPLRRPLRRHRRLRDPDLPERLRLPGQHRQLRRRLQGQQHLRHRSLLPPLDVRARQLLPALQAGRHDLHRRRGRQRLHAPAAARSRRLARR